MKKAFLYALVVVLSAISLLAQPTLVKDIYTGSSSMNPYLSTVANGYVWFYSETSGYTNVYRSDGTTNGTSSFAPCQGYYYGHISGPFNSNLYYAYQEDLYMIDNSFNRTKLRSFSTGNGWGPRNFAYAGNNVFFITQLNWKNTHYTDNQLWKTNGTSSGTSLVKDLYPSNADFITGGLTPFGSNVLFWSNNATNGSELWKSDGTSSGTVMVKDINSGTGHSHFTMNNSTVTEYNMRWMHHGESWKLVYNNKFYFTATDGSYGTEIWEWDGSNDPRRRTNINTNGDSHPFNFCVLDGYLFFTAKDNNNDFELYKLDLSNANSTPSLVKNINSATTGSVKDRSSFPIWLTNFNSKIYFSAYDQTNGRELWETDGTESGTVLVKDINSGSGSSTPNDTNEYQVETRGFFIHNNIMYFMANDGTNGVELWQSDGTADGTSLVANINSGSGNSFPADFKTLGSSIYFAATTGTYGRELWKYTPSNGKLAFGMDELNDGINSKLSVYPNPAQDYLIISADMTEAGQLSISNLLGEELVSLNLNKSNILNQRIDISTLPEGVYIVNLRIGNELLRNKFVKK